MGTSENLRQWSTTAASNASADTGINWAEGQAASSVNDSARSMMAAMAKWMSDNQGALITTGGTTAYTATSATGYTALANGLTIVTRFNAANTGASTLNLDTLGAKAIRKFVGGAESAVVANDMVTNQPYMLVYNTAVNGAAGGWVIMNPANSGVSSLAAGNGVTLSGSTGAVTITTNTGVITTVNGSVAASISFTSSVPTIAKFVLSNITIGTATADLIMNFSTNGGSTYISTGYLHQRVYAATSAPTTVSAAGSASDTSIVLINNLATTATVTGEVVVDTATGYANWKLCYIANGGPLVTASGSAAVATANVNAVKFLPTSGNFAASGSIKMYNAAP